MEYNFIKFKPTNAFVTIVDPKSIPRYMVFKNKNTAHDCISHYANFRSEYGIWPVMDLTSKSTKIHPQLMKKKRTPKELSKFLEIETFDEDEIVSISRFAQMSILYCHSFSVIKDYDDKSMMTVNFSGQEMDYIMDHQRYVKRLDKLISDT